MKTFITHLPRGTFQVLDVHSLRKTSNVKVSLWTNRRTDRQTDGQTDDIGSDNRLTFASGVRQKRELTL